MEYITKTRARSLGYCFGLCRFGNRSGNCKNPTFKGEELCPIILERREEWDGLMELLKPSRDVRLADHLGKSGHSS